jgi:integrase
MRLTDEAIRKAKRPATGQQFLWDDLLQGFGVRLTPTKSSFVVQWRDTTTGKRPRETLRGARVGAVLVAAARDLARKRLSEAVGNVEHGAGVPLRLAMRSWYERQTVLKAWRPRYRAKVDSMIAAYVEGEERERIKLTPSTRAAIEELGSKAVAAVTRTDVLRVTDALKPGTAEQFMGILSSYFGAAYEREIVTGNPARNRLRIFGGRNVRSRKPSEAEFLKLWRAFEAEGDPTFAAFSLLSFTGARRREVTGMRWDELDLDAATWTLPAERRKTGRHDPEPFVITLHPAALAAIRRQPPLDGSPYVFWGRRDKSQFDFQHSLMDRIRPIVADWRLHDLRRYVRSGMARLGITETVAEQCLGHLAGGLVKVYDQHSYAAEKAAAWLKWGDYLSALVANKPP